MKIDTYTFEEIEDGCRFLFVTNTGFVIQSPVYVKRGENLYANENVCSVSPNDRFVLVY